MILDEQLFDKTCSSMNDLGLEMNTLLIKQNDKYFKHVFKSQEMKTNIRSISKPITCLCYGIAIEMGLFPGGLGHSIYNHLTQTQNITNKNNIKYIKKWTIYTLLSLTIGFEKKMLDSKHLKTIDNQNYADVVLNSPLKFNPGEYFIYSNAAMYLASVVFQNATGYKLLDFANKFLFKMLEIENVTWSESPQGYNMGCTGIHMYANDLLKIGDLLLNHGLYNGKRIVSKNWVNKMMSPQVDTPMMYDETRVLPKFAYGLNMWICKDGISYCDGTDGQYLIIIPRHNMTIVTNGFQSNMKPITKCLEDIIRMEKYNGNK